MSILQKKTNLEKACERELAYVVRQEAHLAKSARKDPPRWKAALAEKVPEKLYDSLQAAFGRAFGMIVQQGRPLLEKLCGKNDLILQAQVQDYAIRLTESRKELKKLRKSAGKANFRNSALTAAEGIGLGALGIGLPDIVIFLAVLMKGAYETALRYGYDCDSPREQKLILQMMEAALAGGDSWAEANAGVDSALTDRTDISPAAVEEQIRRTADAFAMELLVLKFIQGLPIVGIAGGLGNPVYYSKIMNYIQLKYYKRYLLELGK